MELGEWDTGLLSSEMYGKRMRRVRRVLIGIAIVGNRRTILHVEITRDIESWPTIHIRFIKIFNDNRVS